MDINNKYFPLISIPYVGPMSHDTPVDFVKRVPGWSALLRTNGDLDDNWIQYWSQHFASRMGRTKAILHLCYGLQCLTPNSQNFLLEYTANMVPTGKVFLRDVLDMRLHTDWVRTLLGCSKPDSSLTSFFDVDIKHMDSRLYDLLKFQAIDTPSPKPTNGPPRKLVQDNETFANLMGPPAGKV
jgi:hypothetical protein